METKIELVTPEMASKLLDTNTNNRNLSHKTVAALSNAMARGEWKMNGDPIRMSRTGVLLDGQHRLSAVVKSGMSFDFLIIYGLDDSVFTTIDTGKKRNGCDALSIDGFNNISTLSAVCRMLVSARNFGAPFAQGKNTGEASLQQLVDFARDDEFVHESARFADGQKAIGKMFQKSNIAYCHYIFNKVSPSYSKDFFDELIGGHYSYRNSPVMALREIFVGFAMRGIKPSRDEKLAYIFKAFKAYRRGAQIKPYA